MEENSDFEKDNAFLLSKFEALLGFIESTKAQNKSLKQQIIGLTFEKENLVNELIANQKNIQNLKSEIKYLKENLEKEQRLIPQNFTIKNKIVKIVSDIEDKEENTQDLANLVGLLINEIEYCINQLEK